MQWIFEKLGCPRRRKYNIDNNTPYEEMPSVPPLFILPILPATPPYSTPHSTPHSTPNSRETPTTPVTPLSTPFSISLSSETTNKQFRDISNTLTITEPLEELIIITNVKEEPTVLQRQIDYITTLIKPHLNNKNRKIRFPYTNNNINLYIAKDIVVSLSVVSFNELLQTCLSLMHTESNDFNWTSHVTKKIVKITNNNYKNTIKSKFTKNSVTIILPKSF